MKLNIFRIPQADLARLEAKLAYAGLEEIGTVEQDGWTGKFVYSVDPTLSDVEWASTFKTFFKDRDVPQNQSYFAVYLFTKSDETFALSFGKSHFYIRPFCDYDFGVELAKRIANQRDIRQTSSKRFQGKKKKDIKSYSADSRLSVESGESVDYLGAAIIDSARDTFGKSGKFGSSAQLSPKIDPPQIGQFLTAVVDVMKQEARFKLPRTVIITEELEVQKLDEQLLDELYAPKGTSDFSTNSFDLYGVDFVFSTEGSYRVHLPGQDAIPTEELSMGHLKDLLQKHHVPREQALRTRISFVGDSRRAKFSQPLKQLVDFIPDDDRVILSGGRWMRFNQDYLEFLDDYIREIRMEEVEPQFVELSGKEGDFNASDAVRNAGYKSDDMDFSVFETASPTSTEAWDLRRGNRVYAVKFGTPQKLGYVCDQANSLLDLFGNKANIKKVPEFREYCLWLGYSSKIKLDNITDSGSIILKQKIELCARKATELGIEPILKISRIEPRKKKPVPKFN